MVVGEEHDGKWFYLVECDIKVSPLCRNVWRKQRTTAYATGPHICKSCHNSNIARQNAQNGIASALGKRNGALAAERGQIQKAGIIGGASLKQKLLTDPVLKAQFAKRGKIAGDIAVSSGQLSRAQKLCCTPEARLKRHNTLVKNGKCFISKPERQLTEMLREHFGHVDVETQLYTLGFHIDLYIRSLSTYIQVDGEYFHGLQKPYEQLSPWQQRKYDIDRMADVAFTKTGARLLRFTDRQLKTMSQSEILSKLKLN